MNRARTAMVSGANGFIGSHLVEHLTRQFGPKQIVSLVRKKTVRSPNIIACDLLNSNELARLLKRYRPSFFFHAAGGSDGTLDELIAGNIFTTLTLLRTLSRIKLPTRVIVLGSAAEYGATRGRSSASKTPLRPGTPYAWTKASQTLLAVQAARAGLDVVIARLFNLTGPRVPSRFSVGSFARQIAAAEQSGAHWIKTGPLSSCRDFVDIRDAASAVVRIAKKGKSGEIYDVCSGSSVSMRRIVDLLLQQARVPLRLRVAAGPRSKGDIPFSLGDPRLLKQLGWKPVYSLKTSLSDTLDYYRSAYRR